MTNMVFDLYYICFKITTFFKQIINYAFKI